MPTDDPYRREIELCCGLPMRYQLIFNVLRYECGYRSGHEAIYVNMMTGTRVKESDFTWHDQDVDVDGDDDERPTTTSFYPPA